MDHLADIEFLMSKKHHLDGDFWTTEDYRIGKGSPFSTRDVAIMLAELGLEKSDETSKGLAETIFKTQQQDGRFRFYPSGAIYPCHTITAARALCYLGYAKDERLGQTFKHLLDTQHEDGGWRCNKTKMGKGEITDCSNPGTTLEALDVFRHTELLNDYKLDNAIEFLLKHWEIKRPLGPCGFGIGTLFMQTEFPFLRYNLFYYCYVLSFYEKATKEKHFQEAFAALTQKLVNGKLMIENTNRRLSKMRFCKKGEPGELATIKYNEIKKRII